MKMNSSVLLIAAALCTMKSPAAEPQNPSPMVEHTRSHPRLKEERPEGRRIPLDRGTLFVPAALNGQPEARLLVMMHGGTWLPEVAAARLNCAVLHWQSASGYAAPFGSAGVFRAWLQAAAEKAGMQWTAVDLAGWSAGCGGIREILRHEEDSAAVTRVLCIDGIHTSYRNGKPGPKESDIDTEKLAPLIRFARQAMAGEKQMLIVHTEIFPGTFASTTETADWMLRELQVKRTAILRWGPMGTQQLSSAAHGKFELRGYAGNSAPDHVDLLHALPELLAVESKSATQEPPARRRNLKTENSKLKVVLPAGIAPATSCFADRRSLY